MVRRGLIVVALSLLLSARIAHAQEGWEARVTVMPNPLRAGGCAGIGVEPVDDHGYRRTTLANGAQIDFRKFDYEVSPATHLAVRIDPSRGAYVCADSGMPSASTTVNVALPDGVKGSAQLFVLALGAPAAPAIVYRRQAPLRLSTSPEYAPGFAAREAQGGAAGGAASGRGRVGVAQRSTNGASATPGTVTITTGTLSLTGARHVPAPVTITTATLSLIGNSHAPAPVIITTAPLSLTGTTSSHPVPVKSPATTSPRSVSTKPPHTR